MIIALLLIPAAFAHGEEKKSPTEDDYYRIVKIPIPDDIVLECGGMEFTPDGKFFVSTRRGDVYLVENVLLNNPRHVRFTKWATGMHEVMGLAFNPKDGFLYAIQRGEVTRLKDTDNRGHANVYETYCDDWGISGDYHEYPWMSKFDKNGDLWVLLTLTGSFTSDARFRGWCLRIKPDGTIFPTCSGIRSPGGIAFNEQGECFYTDNQGPWNGGCPLHLLEPGKFEGHPIGNRWYTLAPNMHPQPQDPQSGSRLFIEAQKIPQMSLPCVIQPYNKLGQSASGIIFDSSNGKFGPFVHQCFVADQHHSNIGRYGLEKVNGRYQGWCSEFRRGFSSGIVPMIQAPDGSFMVGGTSRGWGAVGPKEYSLERLVWTGKTPFEMQDMHVASDGFDLTFTEPVDKNVAGDASKYRLPTWTYIYRAEYGSPEIDQTTATVRKAEVSGDGMKVHLTVDGLQIGHIHELHMEDLRSAANVPLLHSVVYYTLWNIPGHEQLK